MSTQTIHITVLNWDKYNARKDVKAPTWFRLSHSLFEDPEFFDFSHTELCAWIYILSQASRKSSADITVHLSHAERIGRLKEKDFRCALKKLEANGNILLNREVPAHVTDTIVDVTDAASTLHNKTDITNITDTDMSSGDDESELPVLAKLWNQNRGILPRVMECSKERRKKAALRWREKPDVAYWTQIIQRMASSPFCQGNGPTGWKASFDFLLQPDTRIKVSEGKYDGPSGQQNKRKGIAELLGESGS